VNDIIHKSPTLHNFNPKGNNSKIKLQKQSKLPNNSKLIKYIAWSYFSRNARTSDPKNKKFAWIVYKGLENFCKMHQLWLHNFHNKMISSECFCFTQIAYFCVDLEACYTAIRMESKYSQLFKQQNMTLESGNFDKILRNLGWDHHQIEHFHPQEASTMLIASKHQWRKSRNISSFSLDSSSSNRQQKTFHQITVGVKLFPSLFLSKRIPRMKRSS
jgi:hypothetical protein